MELTDCQAASAGITVDTSGFLGVAADSLIQVIAASGGTKGILDAIAQGTTRNDFDLTNWAYLLYRFRHNATHHNSTIKNVWKVFTIHVADLLERISMYFTQTYLLSPKILVLKIAKDSLSL